MSISGNIQGKPDLPPQHRRVEGYGSRSYAESLAEFGELICLPRSGGYLLKRSIPGTRDYDAMGCYPFFFCQDWAGLEADLEALSDELVSVSLVPDPYGDYTGEMLERSFAVVNPFKVHYLVDLQQPLDGLGTPHHRKEAAAALEKIQVEECKDPAGFEEYWSKLYQTLVRRHDIRGIRAFSREAFRRQLSMPETIVHVAYIQEEIVGAQLYFKQGNVVYCHLGAVSDFGYQSGAFYALDAFSFDYFSGQASWLDLGGGAGVSGNQDDGLTRYKKGWSSTTRPVKFCGRITHPARYAALAATMQLQSSNYFPVYRAGEFS
jgi:hypothetical protein